MRKSSPPFKLILPITAALDMSFQLLAFFVLTFRPMSFEGQLAHVKTPIEPVRQGGPIDGDEIRRDDYTIRVYSKANGEIASMSVSTPTHATGNLGTYDALLRELKAIPKPANKDVPTPTITIESANELSYARLVDILNVCKQAGHGSINLAPMRRGPST